MVACTALLNVGGTVFGNRFLVLLILKAPLYQTHCAGSQLTPYLSCWLLLSWRLAIHLQEAMPSWNGTVHHLCTCCCKAWYASHQFTYSRCCVCRDRLENISIKELDIIQAGCHLNVLLCKHEVGHLGPQLSCHHQVYTVSTVAAMIRSLESHLCRLNWRAPELWQCVSIIKWLKRAGRVSATGVQLYQRHNSADMKITDLSADHVYCFADGVAHCPIIFNWQNFRRCHLHEDIRIALVGLQHKPNKQTSLQETRCDKHGKQITRHRHPH